MRPVPRHPAPDPDLTAAPPAGLRVPPGGPAESVGLVQPYQARKRYTCPGCHGAIEVGEGHLVVVPEHHPDLRRHWHRACWHREQRRRQGREA
jgi:hypothetical protein